ncbi:hypothetical protein BRCON_2729 [Candidatus Sumerlaea chitinivorans]|uniref:Uncharacterized protein n=1 Tax=Sumerlaea chitinivorans TaxID=2250252 RepID=A0A2Z4Y8A2_SUMC1|nr:hypothetical protein BRCON_2729 [Candidatus Sumerlaea chitinivorans]
MLALARCALFVVTEKAVGLRALSLTHNVGKRLRSVAGAVSDGDVGQLAFLQLLLA